MRDGIRTHRVAWATVSVISPRQLKPGIIVVTQERHIASGRVVHVNEVVAPIVEIDGDCTTIDGLVDRDALDALLALSGYRRVSGWDDYQGDQLVADVEPTQ